MISEEKFAGNEKVVKYLNKVLKKGCISHAYIFEGPAHIGKTTLALYFAGELLSDTAENILKNPDLMFISVAEDETQISVEAIRNLQKDLSLYPYKSDYKVAIIEKAEQMNTAAANSLLKTLEEPGNTSILILLSSDTTKMLSTIKSRCQTIMLNTVNNHTLKNFLLKKSIGNPTEEILEMAQGKPGTAITLLEDENFLENIRKAKKLLLEIFDCDNFGRMKEAGIIGAMNKKGTTEIMNIWTAVLRQELVRNLESGKNTNRSTERIRNALEKTISTKNDILNNNVNIKLAIENLCLSF